MPVTLDYLYHPRPLGLAKLLLTHGFLCEKPFIWTASARKKKRQIFSGFRSMRRNWS